MRKTSPVLKDLIGDDHLQWQELGRCRQSDPETWFPEKGSPISFAVRVCNLCPVRVECLDFALGTREQYGIWGGKTEQERQAMLRKGYATAA